MAYLALMRPLVCLSAAGAALAGLVALGFPEVGSAKVLLAPLSIFLLMGFADAFNDYFDREIDALNTPWRPIPSGKVSPRGALWFSTALLAGGNAAAWGVNPTMGLSAAALSFLYIAYGLWSKRLGFAKNLLIATTGSGSLLLSGAALHRANAVLFAAGAHVFLMMLAVEIAKDVEDMRGDSACGARTWALAVGERTAMRASVAAVAAGLAAALWTGPSWPLYAGAAGLSLAPFLKRLPARTPTLVLSGAALGVAAVVLGGFSAP